MFSLFKKFKDGLTKTFSAIAAKTHGLFGGRRIDAASLDELEEALYTADFGVETTTEMLQLQRLRRISQVVRYANTRRMFAGSSRGRGESVGADGPEECPARWRQRRAAC